VIRHALPESVRFLQSKGREAEAESVVRDFEKSAGVASPAEPVVETVASTPVRGRFAELWSPEHRRRTIGLWGVWFFVNFAYYGAFTWLPSLLLSQGITLTKSFGYTVIITAAQLPGYAVAAW